jgi:hypothetical protein
MRESSLAINTFSTNRFISVRSSVVDINVSRFLLAKLAYNDFHNYLSFLEIFKNRLIILLRIFLNCFDKIFEHKRLEKNNDTPKFDKCFLEKGMVVNMTKGVVATLWLQGGIDEN